MNEQAPAPLQRRRDRTAGMTYEQQYLQQGKTVIVGMDEAGYGAWAGPVAAAAVCLPLTDSSLIEQLHGVKDSKQMTARQRQTAFDVIKDVALGWGIGHATPAEIGTLGLSPALSLTFTRAYKDCADMLGETDVEVLIIDGKSTWRDCPHAQTVLFERVPDGDHHSLTIAAASVLAKVWRDDQMVKLAADHPAYGFDRHKGYGTQAHSAALREHGVLRGVHRRNYKPIAALLE